ncbi:hypothetical protein [Melittangium boletus]|uniref:hypothetical protein n=1 Tax=Melittangium boletus TaxID=83453 RepID=UPI003DA43854
MREGLGWMKWGVCVVLVGCGAPRESAAPEPVPLVEEDLLPAPVEPPAPAPVESRPPAPVPVESVNLEGSPTLSPGACVPWTGQAPPERAQACQVTSVGSDGWGEVARYDGEGHLLERSHLTDSGERYKWERSTWVDGRETFRRVESSIGWNQSEWVYDGAGRLSKRTETSFQAERLLVHDYTYVYAANGQLERIDRQSTNGPMAPVRYHYDTHGQLTDIDSSPGCDMTLSPCGTLTYWPEGPVRESRWTNEGFWGSTKRYDEQGRLVDEEQTHYNSAQRTLTTYGADQRVSRIWERGAFRSTVFQSLRTFHPDASGQLQLERLAKVENGPVGPLVDGQPTYLTTTWFVTRRLTYLCGTELVALEEWDIDQDGVVDARRTHERDARGRLVRETYSGPPVPDMGPVRRDHTYTCD